MSSGSGGGGGGGGGGTNNDRLLKDLAALGAVITDRVEPLPGFK